ncbi:MAG: hybrid sensor histidine kinase/response regulator [Chitinivibrionales bacterium]|nr:hybrid sensor histidine kinase/response regulator [Chitinivibrionales bacterium]
MNTEYKILVVDDSDENREMVSELLLAHRFKVDKACNGKEALIKLAATVPDIFLLDVAMPQMGGLELLDKISVKDNAYEAIMMTGNESLNDAKKAMELGAFSYVSKPLQWEEINDHLQRALSLVGVKKERMRHLKALEDEIRKSNKDLQAANQLRASFLSIVAHELRTPITTLMNYLAVLTGPENVEAVNDMKTTCDRLKDLVASLISLADLSSTSIAVRQENTHIPSFVEMLARKFAGKAAENKVAVIIDNLLSESMAAIDPRLLNIALMSLIDNAIKFSKEGGAVHINLKDLPDNGPLSLLISVSDRGCGISERARTHLFESFTQGEEHLTRHFGGLGTGLFLAKRAAEIMGASIEVTSDKGKGSKFTLNIPVPEAACQK